MPTWTSTLSPFRHPLDRDIHALAAAVRRTKEDIAAGGQRGRALRAAVAARFGLVAAARMHWARDARWRVAVMRVGGGPGAGRYVEAAVNRMVKDSGVRVLTAA